MNVNAQKTEEIAEHAEEEVVQKEVSMDAVTWNDVAGLSIELRLRF